MATRVDAVDAARGVALVGMMLAHIGPRSIDGTPNVAEIVSHGRAAPLFALLAGVALTLVHRRDPDGAGRISATAIRAVILVVLGLALGSLEDVPVFVILAYYGVLILVALPARYLPTRWLVGLAGAWIIGGPVVMLLIRMHHDPAATVQPTWDGFQEPWILVDTLTWSGAYPLITWFAYLLVGLAVGRLALDRTVVAGRLVVAGVLLTLIPVAVAWLAIRQGWANPFDTTWRGLFALDDYPYVNAEWDDLWNVGPHAQMPLNLISVIGSSLLVLGLCALVSGRLPLLREAGAMTLTLYVVHVLWTWRAWVTSDEYAADRLMDVGWDVWGIQVAVLLAAAWLWRRVFRRGPLEQVMRWISVSGPNQLRRL